MKNQQELMEEYLYYGLKQRKLDEKMIRAYGIDLRQFSEFCAQEELVMSKETIRQYILYLHEIYKQKTVKRKIASLKAFYSYLEEEEIIEDNPMRKIRNNVDRVLKDNFGDRFNVSIEKCMASAEMAMEETFAIVVSENEGQTMPWLSFLIFGEQIIINHMNISIYTLYRPDKVDLGDNVYEQNQAIQKNVLSLKKKQNPKINNLVQIIFDLIVKELENWVNSQQSQSIYE